MAAKKPKSVTLRKPPSAPDAAAFVAGGGAKPAQKSTTTVTRKRTGAELRRMTIYLPDDVARAIKVRCAQEGRTITDVMSELAGKWVAE